jgi:hypothetical protein
MQLVDVDVLINAFRPDAPQHKAYHSWVEQLVAGNEHYAMSELVLSAVVRILTDGRIYGHPETVETAFGYAELLAAQPQCVIVRPGSQHWKIFSRLCLQAQIRGRMVSDAYHAALAIEHGCEWVTADKHFGRFPGLRWRHPLD